MSPASPATEVRFGTRGSELALWQTRWVIARLTAADSALDATEVVISTMGDSDLATPLPELGGTGAFTQAVEAALLAGEVDVAVHSLKDLPIEANPKLTLAAVCNRADPRDVLVSRHALPLDSLGESPRIGTSSNRRAAQIRLARPDAQPSAIRGNVDTRVREALAGDIDGVCIAAAGVERLGLSDHVSQYFDPSVFLPAPGQGALAVQCRARDDTVVAALRVLDEPDVRAAVMAERSFLKTVGGGCTSPVGAFARHVASGELRVSGIVADIEGRRSVRVEIEGSTTVPEELGVTLAERALAQGAGELL